jgi:hypothetical protein
VPQLAGAAGAEALGDGRAAVARQPRAEDDDGVSLANVVLIAVGVDGDGKAERDGQPDGERDEDDAPPAKTPDAAQE